MAKKETTETLAEAVPVPQASDNPGPPPGGGRWFFDIAKPGWVDLDAAPVNTEAKE